MTDDEHKESKRDNNYPEVREVVVIKYPPKETKFDETAIYKDYKKSKPPVYGRSRRRR